jgi:hypothetical protein
LHSPEPLGVIPMSEDNTNDNDVDQEEIQKEMAKMMANVKDMTLYNLSVLASQAWHHLGLNPIPGLGDPELDMEQAKLAIDLFDANLKIMSEHIDKDIDKQLKQTLMDLQLNYVNKSK